MNQKRSAPTRADQLVQQLASEIIRGQRSAGEALPPERELSEQLNVSRPTLREALRQLERLGLVASRHGSGTKILEWQKTATIDVFPIYLQLMVGTSDFTQLVASSLRVRRAPIVEAIRWLAAPERGVNFLRLRQQVAHVWTFHNDPVQFIVEDFEWMKQMALASRYFPALWVMNAFVANYVKLVAEVGLAAPPQPDYVETWNQILDACKSGDQAVAAELATAYFERHDQDLMRFISPQS